MLHLIVQAFNKLDASTWIALASLLISIPALCLSLRQWSHQKSYDATKEKMALLNALAEQSIGVAKILLRLEYLSPPEISLRGLDPDEEAVYRHAIEVNRKLVQMWGKLVDTLDAGVSAPERLWPAEYYAEMTGTMSADYKQMEDLLRQSEVLAESVKNVARRRSQNAQPQQTVRGDSGTRAEDGTASGVPQP